MSDNNTSVLVLKTDLYKAAWRLKRSVFKNRMCILRREAKKKARKPSLWQRMCGVKNLQPTKSDIHRAAKELWEMERGYWGKIEHWHIGGWGTLGIAKRLIKLSKTPGVKYVRLSSNDAEELSAYWDS